MQTVLLTIVSSHQSIDLKLPAEVPIGDLMSRIKELCGVRDTDAAPSKRLSWHLLLPSTGEALDAGRSLSEAGVIDGTTLLLRNNASIEQQRAAPVFQPKTIIPGEESGGIGIRWYIPHE